MYSPISIVCDLFQKLRLLAGSIATALQRDVIWVAIAEIDDSWKGRNYPMIYAMDNIGLV